jgi:hypothetical protein
MNSDTSGDPKPFDLRKKTWGECRTSQPMKTCNRHFPGTELEISRQFQSDVAADEKAIVEAIAALRQKESLEAIGFLLGADPAQISRHLKGTRSTTLTNYIRIARALGYRCKIVLEKAEPSVGAGDVLSELKIAPHKVLNV